MDSLLKIVTLFCLLFWQGALAAPIKRQDSNDGISITPTPQSGDDEYVVIVDKDVDFPPRIDDVLARLAMKAEDGEVRQIYNNSAFYGFAASMKSPSLELLANMTDVKLVEHAVKVASSLNSYDTRQHSPWGLQRISTAAHFSGDPEAMEYSYTYSNSNLGKGSDIYIIDTGIYTQNNIFGGRAKNLWSFDGTDTDVDGHGTHVAGTAGGDTLGVASKANIFGLKALDSEGGGLSSNVVAAIDKIIRQHDERKAAGGDFKGSVMSMSLASEVPVVAINNAIAAAIQAGIHTVVAAGNNGANACDVSPAASGGTHGPAITVGAIGIDATRADFSNSGECVDVYAPGENIISAWIGGNDMVNSLSGTSMATPHVTGIIAYAMVRHIYISRPRILLTTYSQANSTLAGNPALMKEWIRMNSLQLPDGTLMANNGVHADNSMDISGLNKAPAKRNSKRSTPAQAKRSLVGVDPLPRGVSLDTKLAFSRVDTEMACRHEAQLHESTAFLHSKSCNSGPLRKRGLIGEAWRSLVASTSLE